MAKNKKSQKKRIATIASRTGFVLMAMAATIGMIELPEQERNKMIAPSQPVLAFANENVNDHGSNPLRREREETGPHYVSYSEVQRTPARAGRF